MNSLLTPILMCGGAGTRLWPVSRESMPKQFTPLVGDKSTFRQLIERISAPDLFNRPIVVTSADFRFVVAEQLRECGVEADIVLEPMRRDSGPAVAAAAAIAAKRDPASVLLVLAADHIVRKPDRFIEACRSALPAARDGKIVTFGIKPTYPATSYGYIRPGQKLDGGDAVLVDAFVEKPDAATASKYVADNYLWNSGNFMFRADVMLAEIAHFEPAMAEAVAAAVAASERDLDFLRLGTDAFGRAPKKSIDYAVMERTKHAAVIPADVGWTDLGSWDAVWDVADKDAAGNATAGPVVTVDSKNVLVRSDESVLTTVVGVDDVVVVATDDAVLVVSRAKAEKVKELVETLKTRNHREATEHRRIYRPWGYYQSVDAGTRYQVKRIVVNAGSKLSLQKHFHRAEHWVVVKGTAEVTINGHVKVVHENESIYVPIGSAHRLANPGKIPLELIEVQSGSYLGEDDIVRLDDIYGRR
jgi:mannose-1-phosphate guanylyltransferase/mannose-6-phosphate isomerase